MSEQAAARIQANILLDKYVNDVLSLVRRGADEDDIVNFLSEKQPGLDAAVVRDVYFSSRLRMLALTEQKLIEAVASGMLSKSDFLRFEEMLQESLDCVRRPNGSRLRVTFQVQRMQDADSTSLKKEINFPATASIGFDGDFAPTPYGLGLQSYREIERNKDN